MSSSQKPDLDENINVAKAHERVDREVAAAAREKRIDDQGNEPITLWVLAACGIVAVIAGGILNWGGKLFSYKDTFRAGYVRQATPGEDSGPVLKPLKEAMMARGRNVYSANCVGCHQPAGQGKSDVPPLADSAWVTGETERLALIILNGLSGPTSTGKAYPSAMPAQNVTTPEDLAAIMTYIRNNFGNSEEGVVSVEMAKAALTISKDRATNGKTGNVTGAELADHAQNLPGDPVDPNLMVDPKTLLPPAEAP